MENKTLAKWEAYDEVYKGAAKKVLKEVCEAHREEKKEDLEAILGWDFYVDAEETYWKGIESWAESVAHAYSEREE